MGSWAGLASLGQPPDPAGPLPPDGVGPGWVTWAGWSGLAAPAAPGWLQGLEELRVSSRSATSAAPMGGEGWCQELQAPCPTHSATLCRLNPPPHLTSPSHPAVPASGEGVAMEQRTRCGPSLSFFPFLLPSFYFRGKGGSERLCHFPKLPQRGSEGCRSKA